MFGVDQEPLDNGVLTARARDQHHRQTARDADEQGERAAGTPPPPRLCASNRSFQSGKHERSQSERSST